MHINFCLHHFCTAQDEIFCTSYVTAYYLKHTLHYQGKVFLVGMEGFGSELELMGMTYVGPGPDHIQGEAPEWSKTVLDPEVGPGVGGWVVAPEWSKAPPAEVFRGSGRMGWGDPGHPRYMISLGVWGRGGTGVDPEVYNM